MVRTGELILWVRDFSHVLGLTPAAPPPTSLSPSPSTSPNNIGRGLGCRTWVTDKHDHNQLVPISCVGELCVEGPIVTRGYKVNPQQTAAAYVESPAFTGALSITSMRMYKTGDLVRYESDGTLLYVGHKDSQVKIRGQRIELSEIEHHIVVANSGSLAAGREGNPIQRLAAMAAMAAMLLLLLWPR
jgi:non-ribosomal peptide synthetase component F